MLSQRPVGIGLAPTAEQGARITYPLIVGPSLLTGNATLFGSTLTFDLTMEDENGTINNVQTMYVDNSLSPSAFLFTFPETGQTIWAAAKTQGYYPIAIGQQGQMQARCMTPGGSTGYSCMVQFLNVPVQASQWSTAQEDSAFVAFSQTTVGNTAFTVNPLNPFPGMGPTNFPGLYGGLLVGKFALKIYGFDVTGTGATASSDIQVELASPVSGFSFTSSVFWDVFVPVIGTGNVNFSKKFDPPLYPAGGTTQMLLSVPAFGAGNTFASASLYFGLV
jgi:hypothetical protein